MNKRTVWIIAVVVLVVTLTSIAYRAIFPGSFDSARWKSADSPAEYLARRDMMQEVNRLLTQQTIADADTAQKLLGAPERRDDTPPGMTWYYDLGDERSSSAPGPRQWLQLGFDESGKLVAHHIRIEQNPGEPATRPLTVPS
jgi:hypothetical protein